MARIEALIADGADLAATDENGRTPVHVAAFFSNDDALAALVGGGADPKALDDQRYDAITIAGLPTTRTSSGRPSLSAAILPRSPAPMTAPH